ncbi:hypothetical protein LSUE1_G005972 [Lachnellula suecica]|uniref:Uncharacterized protein n=1 Tax=Lachnellula suecica TaxID=602035 RepID=A0A8T9C4Z3_9HELO|nr:hypothetical protein LSUE1_G005972 [Lachnellula suecica]
MALIIELPLMDAFNAFINVVKRRIEGNRVRKEKEKSKLICKDYRQMQTNLNNANLLDTILSKVKRFNRANKKQVLQRAQIGRLANSNPGTEL